MPLKQYELVEWDDCGFYRLFNMKLGKDNSLVIVLLLVSDQVSSLRSKASVMFSGRKFITTDDLVTAICFVFLRH